jgi:Tfp pilus assembly protein PilX
MNKRQKGIATLIALMALVIMLLASLALIRSTGVTQTAAGNLAFRRDLANRGERAIQQASAPFLTGDLATPAARTNSVTTDNYSAITLPSNTDGIPRALLDDGVFAACCSAADLTDAASQVTLRYVVDRMCTVTGTPTLPNCAIGLNTYQTSLTAGEARASGAVYTN